MHQIDFNQIKQQHFNKDCSALNDISAAQNTLSCLNSALLDKDIKKINSFKKRLLIEGCKYNLINITDLIKNESRLKIVYLIPSTGITGGTRILIEQSNELANKGHDVLLFSHCPKPVWINCKTNFFLVHPDSNLSDVVPAADIVIAGYWSLVVDALKINAPLKYHFAQGDFDIFEFDTQEPYIKNAIKTAYSLPLKILTVSDIMKQKINTLFGRKSIKIPNALGHEFFLFENRVNIENNPLEILLVGSDAYGFKGHEIILNTLHYFKVLGYSFNVNWLTQNKLQGDYSSFGFSIKEHISPSQNEVRNIYRYSDIFICGSYYESFGLPALEAMASSTAVITSDNGGAKEYAVDGYNCLLFEPGNIFMLANKLQALMDNPYLRLKLKNNGLLTARRFTWSKSAKKMEREFRSSSIQAFKKS